MWKGGRPTRYIRQCTASMITLQVPVRRVYGGKSFHQVDLVMMMVMSPMCGLGVIKEEPRSRCVGENTSRGGFSKRDSEGTTGETGEKPESVMGKIRPISIMK